MSGIIVPDLRLRELESEIGGNFETIAEKIIASGAALTEAKSLLSHGDWLNWLTTRSATKAWVMSVRLAEYWMAVERVMRGKSATFANLLKTGLYALTEKDVTPAVLEVALKLSEKGVVINTGIVDFLKESTAETQLALVTGTITIHDAMSRQKPTPQISADTVQQTPAQYTVPPAGTVTPSSHPTTEGQTPNTPPPPAVQEAENPPRVFDDTEQRVINTRCAPIIKRMNDGDLSPAKAWELWTVVSKCQPPVRYDMLRHGMTDSAVILELNEWFKKGRESYAEVIQSGYVQMADRTVPLTKAKMADLHDYTEEKRQEYRRAAAALKDAEKGIVPVNLTLYLNDPQRNAEILMSLLGEKNARKTARAVIGKAMGKRKVARVQSSMVGFNVASAT